MCVLNDLDRFHLVGDVIDRVPKLGARAAYAKQAIRDKLIEHLQPLSRQPFGGSLWRVASTCVSEPRLLRKLAMLSEARWLAPDRMCCDRLTE